jgi:hypothetical protein
MIVGTDGIEIYLDDNRVIRDKVENWPCIEGRLRTQLDGINPRWAEITYLLVPYETRAEHQLLKQYFIMRGDVYLSSITSWRGNSGSRVYIYNPELLQTAKDLLLSDEDPAYERRE